mgnify:CR=1 FL=1
MLSEQNKTGIEPPSDFQFEEYGKAQTLNKPSQGLSKEKKKKGFGNLLRKQKKVSLSLAKNFTLLVMQWLVSTFVIINSLNHSGLKKFSKSYILSCEV